MKKYLAAALIPAIICIASCGQTKTEDTDTDLINDADTGLPPEICLSPGDGPYTLRFTDITKETGFGEEGLAVAGTLISVTDINNDNWPDLFISRGSNQRQSDTNPDPYRLLVNKKGVFEDWTTGSGLFKARDGSEGRATTFIAWGDVNNDGFTDAFSAVYNDINVWDPPDISTIFMNNGNNTFTIGPDYTFSASEFASPTVGASFLDYNRDGKLDLFVGQHYGQYGDLNSSVIDTLYQGLGTGGFADVTAVEGLLTLDSTEETMSENTNTKPTWGVTACDIDGDGWTDLMTTSYGRYYNMLWRNTGTSFENLSLFSRFMSDDITDYSDDQWYLCYCATHENTGDYCAGATKPLISCTGLENAWVPGFSDQPYRLGGNSSNTVCADFDGDGDMDLLGVELAHWHIGRSSDKTELLMNEGFPSAPFVRPGRDATGLTRSHPSVSWDEGDLGGAGVDFDNDGRIDIFIASSDYPGTFSLLYQQQADGTFLEIEKEAGAKINRNHGLGVIDIDRDGDYDLVLGTSLMRWSKSDIPPAPAQPWVYVLRNDTGAGANKVMIHLEGAGKDGKSNRSAIGAKIFVKAGGKTFIREIQGGYGLQGHQQDPLQIIGIGNACAVDSVEIRWPDTAGTVSVFPDVRANYVLKINEETGLTYQTLEEYSGK